MPHLTNGRGYPTFDRRFKEPVGRIKKTYGTDDPATMTGLNVMMQNLYEKGEYAKLTAIRDGKVTMLTLYAAWKANDYRAMANADTMSLFDPTAFDWLKTYKDASENSKATYRQCYNQLVKIKKDFTIGELPDILSQYRKKCYKAGKLRMFTATRNACRSFLRNYYSLHHPTYLAIADIKPLNDSPRRKASARSVKTIVEVTDKLKPEYAAMVWTMCLTSAGHKEYENGVVLEGDGIRVKGEKMARVDDRRNRLVPRVDDPAPYVCNADTLRDAVREASGGKVTPYDFRRTFSHWCREAGIEWTRSQQYGGWAPKSTMEKYSQTEISRFLKDDAEKLRKYVEGEKAKIVKVRPEVMAQWEEFGVTFA